MASEKLINKPSNRVIQGDVIGPMFGKVAAAATVTYLIPGKLVSMLTNDNEIDIGGTDDSSFNVGIIGYEDTPSEYRPATITTAYAVADLVAIHNTPGMRFKGWVLNSAAITPGTRMCHINTDTSGNLQAVGSAGSATMPDVLAVALETVAATPGTSAVACWMRWVG